MDAKEIAKSIRTGGDLDAIILTGPALYTVRGLSPCSFNTHGSLPRF